MLVHSIVKMNFIEKQIPEKTKRNFENVISKVVHVVYLPHHFLILLSYIYSISFHFSGAIVFF